ncbi:hypothetical protein HJ590_10410 [Naumannella sp. ID2617S]|nr:hypothetical protein [Naumannella sp. ID2617S]
MLDGSVGSVISGVTVSEVGEEGVHFRSCSSDGVLERSLITRTGRTRLRFGEGVYVGSANSNPAHAYRSIVPRTQLGTRGN